MRNLRAIYFVVTLAGCISAAPAMAGSHSLPVFSKAVQDIGIRCPIPIYLPTALPSALGSIRGKSVSVKCNANGYKISLYYASPEAGDAGFAGMISGSPNVIQSELSGIPNVHTVKLSNGRAGLFRPVSCGGSCAPANLWWTERGYQFQIQLRLSPDVPKVEQEKDVTKMANSMALYTE